MNRTAFAFLSGLLFSALAGALLIYVMHGELQAKQSKAYHDGEMSVINMLEKEFGVVPYANQEYEKIIYQTKTTEVVVVKENGVKTIKVTYF